MRATSVPRIGSYGLIKVDKLTYLAEERLAESETFSLKGRLALLGLIYFLRKSYLSFFCFEAITLNNGRLFLCLPLLFLFVLGELLVGEEHSFCEADSAHLLLGYLRGRRLRL